MIYSMIVCQQGIRHVYRVGHFINLQIYLLWGKSFENVAKKSLFSKLGFCQNVKTILPF